MYTYPVFAQNTAQKGKPGGEGNPNQLEGLVPGNNDESSFKEFT